MGRNCLPQEGRGNVRRARTDVIHLFWMGSVRGFACLTCEQFSLTSHLHLRDPKERTVSSWSSCLGRPQPGWRHPSQTQKSQQSLSFLILLHRTRGAGLGWQLHNLYSLLKINGLFTQTEWTLQYVNYTLIKPLQKREGKKKQRRVNARPRDHNEVSVFKEQSGRCGRRVRQGLVHRRP